GVVKMGVNIMKNMDYKMLVLDLDDSLLGDDLNIDRLNKNAILAAIQKGILVTIATGRMFCSALPYAKQLGIDVPMITYNGALIKNSLSNETLIHTPIEQDIVGELISDSKKNGYHIQPYIDDKYYIEQENEYSRYYYKISGQVGNAVGDLEKLANEQVTK